MPTDNYLICSECKAQVPGGLDELTAHYQETHPEFVKILQIQQKMFFEEKPAMLVPFMRIKDNDDIAVLSMIALHTDVWLDGDLEAAVIIMPEDDKAAFTQFLLDLPTAGYINLR